MICTFLVCAPCQCVCEYIWMFSLRQPFIEETCFETEKTRVQHEVQTASLKPHYDEEAQFLFYRLMQVMSLTIPINITPCDIFCSFYKQYFILPLNDDLHYLCYFKCFCFTTRFCIVL